MSVGVRDVSIFAEQILESKFSHIHYFFSWGGGLPPPFLRCVALSSRKCKTRGFKIKTECFAFVLVLVLVFLLFYVLL